jgi:hypothetical protein
LSQLKAYINLPFICHCKRVLVLCPKQSPYSWRLPRCQRKSAAARNDMVMS